MELGVLKDIVIIFALSTFVNFIFTRIKVPAIIGYLITGVIAGPHLLPYRPSSQFKNKRPLFLLQLRRRLIDRYWQ